MNEKKIGKTISEIANEMGVSTTTVKLVVNGQATRYRIAKRTQDKIKKYIDEYGIIINHTARSLKLKKTNTLGLVVPRLTNIFFSLMTEWLEYQCVQKGYQLITVCTDSDPVREQKVIKKLVERGVDGLFIVSSTKEQQRVTARNIVDKPILFLDRDFKIDGQSTVVSDNYFGFFELSRTILKKSVHEIYMICGDTELPSIKDRLQGFVDGHHKLQQPLTSNWLHAVPHNRFQDGYEGMSQLINELNRLPESIVFSSLPILEGGLHFIKQRYGVIPHNLVIGTFDDHTMLEFLPNTVISVQQDAKSIAEHASSIMNSAIETKIMVGRNIVVAPQIIIRN
ncbi:LacI family DNA-binding transcriptional regulator [Vibrio sp. MA40-2]|uniref:LacI family DNA-binding transcriptional regulator n=1 Tax=Vibrio sp. MA40-2 TaxID=3391828 RepID=UPI0039A65230